LVNNDRQLLGAAGEDRVIARYVENGFVLVDRNWHDGRSGELDLVFSKVDVATGQHLVVVCEVKTRRTDTYGDGLEAVTATKQRRLRKLAASWLNSHRDTLSSPSMAGRIDPRIDLRIDLRIDVAAVRLGRGPAVVEIVEAAC
jgi:putative endonuclease